MRAVVRLGKNRLRMFRRVLGKAFGKVSLISIYRLDYVFESLSTIGITCNIFIIFCVLLLNLNSFLFHASKYTEDRAAVLHVSSI